MARATFEEKEYESAALGELMCPAGGASSFAMSAGQVLERVVGYDAAAAPSPAHVVWRILRMPRPSGVRLLPTMWQPQPQPDGARLPRTPVTLVLQFKRPEYMFGPAARQWRLWHRPYYRFELRPGQQRVLSTLEGNAGLDVLVRYAAPAFWQRGDLEAAHLRREVLGQSGFVSPQELKGHRWWTYLGPGIDGQANQFNRFTRFETWGDVVEALSVHVPSPRALVPVEALGDHVVRVGDAAAEAAPAALRRQVINWARMLRRSEPELTGETVARVRAIAMISTSVAKAGAVWFLADTR